MKSGWKRKGRKMDRKEERKRSIDKNENEEKEKVWYERLSEKWGENGEKG